MTRLQFRGYIRSGVLAALALAFLAYSGVKLEAGTQWWQDKRPDYIPIAWDMSREPDGFRITDPAGKPVSLTPEERVRQGAVSNHTNQEAFVSGLTKYGPNTEIAVTFRLNPAEGKSASVTLEAGLATPDDAADSAINVTISAAGNGGVANCVCRLKEKTLINRDYTFKPELRRNLAWPEDVRRTIEQNYSSLPSLQDKWFTLKLVLRPNGFRVYIDDRLLEDRTGSEFNAQGLARIRLSPDVLVAPVMFYNVESTPLYEPIGLDGYVNASKIGGDRISSLPPSEKVTSVSGIPFEFPRGDMSGNDHIDIGKSWAYFANLDGYIESPERWEGAFNVNPARIQLSVPNDLYSSIHLICAADGDKDTVPIITAQFYYPSIGFPVNCEARAPLFTAKSSSAVALPVKTQGGGKGNLYLVTIPIDVDKLSSLVGWDEYVSLPSASVYGGYGRFEIELTKEVKQYRSYPDPICYDFHQAGQPSGVQVYAMTLERQPVNMDFRPDKFAHVWTQPEKPSYTVTLKNRTAAPRKVELALSTVSDDGAEKVRQARQALIPAGGALPVKFSLPLRKLGYHKVVMTMTDAGRKWTENRSLVIIHSETRERGNWDHGRGLLLGCWDAGSGWHCGPGGPGGGLRGKKLMFDAGLESGRGWIPDSVDKAYREEANQIAAKAGLTNTQLVKNDQIPSQDYFRYWTPDKPGWTKDVAAKGMVDLVKKDMYHPGPYSRPEFIMFWAEPSLGPVTSGNYPEYWGDPPYVLTDSERSTMEDMSQMFVVASGAIKKEWPNTKVLMPYGDPLFIVPFLRAGIITKDLLDGTALDMPRFERVPEMQLGQDSLHRLYELRAEYKKFGISNPYLISIEGPFLPTLPGALTYKEQADYYTRNTLLMMVYGVDQIYGSWQAFDYASYYGAEHYGNAGIIERIPHCSPKQGYAALATMTRHLNRKNFDKWVPTGSLSAYCLQWKHYKNGSLVHTLWTIRGKRTVTVRVPAGAKPVLYTQMDNATSLRVRDGKVSFTINQSPCYVHGLGDNPHITLGDPDNSDSSPAKGATRIANLGDGSWTLSSMEDKSYAGNSYLVMDRKVGKMGIHTLGAPAAQGRKALAVHLDKANKARKGMPYYTTLVPKKPIIIPGKAGHIGMWVHASSDWGRVVYCLRDAKGERWISVGSKDQYNCDDTHLWSFFNFDGWRYLRFEMPSNSSYDSYRELGSTWWGHPEAGDGIVDLPLKLEKIIVERRNYAMYVNGPQPTRRDDVMLADLYAEYEKPSDRTADVVRLSRLRMPAPQGIPNLSNPIKEMAKTGVGEPTALLGVTPPTYQPDGTRCLVQFKTVEGARSYDLWVSAYPDGTGAMKLGSGWTESGKLLEGLRPDVDFYLFIVYTDRDGKLSRPSEPLKFRLTDLFFFK